MTPIRWKDSMNMKISLSAKTWLIITHGMYDDDRNAGRLQF